MLISNFMSTASLCKKYVKMKQSKNIEKYISERNINAESMGQRCRIICAAIWLEVDIYVLIDQTWQKFYFMGFNPKRGKNVSSPNNIYLENRLDHYETVVSVAS